MTWLLGIGGLLKQALSALLDFARRNPWQFAVLLLLGLSAWLWWGKQSETRRADAWHHAWQAQKNASDAAAAAQKALNAKIQNTYQEQADDAQERYDAISDRGRDAVRDYIASHRVRPSRGASCGSDTAPAASGAPVPANTSPAPVMVAVSQRDVETCQADYSYARAAYEWADSLLKAGVAK